MGLLGLQATSELWLWQGGFKIMEQLPILELSAAELSASAPLSPRGTSFLCPDGPATEGLLASATKPIPTFVPTLHLLETSTVPSKAVSSGT